MILRVEIVSLLQVTLGRLLVEGVVSFALQPPPHLHRHHHTFSEVTWARLSYVGFIMQVRIGKETFSIRKFRGRRSGVGLLGFWS